MMYFDCSKKGEIIPVDRRSWKVEKSVPILRFSVAKGDEHYAIRAFHGEKSIFFIIDCNGHQKCIRFGTELEDGLCYFPLQLQRFLSKMGLEFLTEAIATFDDGWDEMADIFATVAEEIGGGEP